MKPNRWRSIGRVLGAGIALVLLLGASGKGCDDSSGGGDFGCPKAEAAGQMDMTVGAAVRLPAGDLDEDLKRAHEIAQRVADAADGTGCTRLTQNEEGYRVAVPFKRHHPVLVRVMARGAGRENYYRISVDGKGSVDEDGNYSHDAKATHHDLPDDTDDAVDEILDLIDKTKEKNG